jgi:hypothetical protein
MMADSFDATLADSAQGGIDLQTFLLQVDVSAAQRQTRLR